MKKTILLIALSILLIIPNFIHRNINGDPVYNHIERFNPDLSGITSIDELERYTDDSAATQHIEVYSEKYVALLSYIISCRFYHGFSHFALSENWIAALGEKVFGYGLACEVDPQDILQHSYAACSQQSIVMMAVLRKKNITYRKVGFPHHYALEAKINCNWYFFDPDMEPAISLNERLHKNWNGNNDHLKKYYSAHGNVNWQFGNGARAEFGVLNEVPAQHAKLFQNITAILSRILWCVPLCLALIKKRRRKGMYAIKPVNHFPSNKNLNPVFSA